MAKDLTGRKFGKLTVIKLDHIKRIPHGARTYWECKCDCGKTTVVRSDCLTSGTTRSCGCMIREDRRRPDSIYKHPLYRVYWAIKQRCYDENCKHYDRHGKRGIRMCDEWLNSYPKFYQWAMNNGYKKGLTIDRANNDGNYEPENCRWIPQSEQGNNTSRNRIFEYDGKKQNVSQWARELGFSVDTLYARLVKSNWPVEKALTEPVRNQSVTTIPKGSTSSIDTTVEAVDTHEV